MTTVRLPGWWGLSLSVAVFLAACHGSAPPSAPGGAPVETPVAAPGPSPHAVPTAGTDEQVVLAPGADQIASGFTLTLGATPFETIDMSGPDVSSPAVARQNVELIVSREGQSSTLHFTEPSPGVASRVRNEWQGHAFILESVDHVDGSIRVVIRVEALGATAER